MKILVCMKQVPQKDAPLKLNEAGTWIREGVSYEVNEPDAFALEEALRQKEKHSGEVVAIFVVRKDPALTAEQVIQHSKQSLTGYKVPKHVYFRTELPKSNVGKILRRALRDELKIVL